MPAKRAGSSTGGQGKAVPVEQTAVQLCLPIATAENPRRRTRDRLGALRAGAPEAIVNAESAAPATMEEVAYRLTGALLNVASNKGAPGPDGQTIEARCLSSGGRVAQAAGRSAGGSVPSRRDSPAVHSQGGRRAARVRDSAASCWCDGPLRGPLACRAAVSPDP